MSSSLTDPPLDHLLSPQTLSDLVGAIYDCVLDPSRWLDALAAIRRELHCHNAVLGLQALPSGEMLVNITEGIEGQWLERMPDYGADVVELWGGLAVYHATPLLEPLVWSQMAPPGYERNRYYREWAVPQGLTDSLAIALTRDSVSLGSIGFGWHESAGVIGARETGIARLLAPHLHRAAVITRVIEARSLVAATFEAALDTLGTPIVLVGQDLTIVHANLAAQALFRRRVPLLVERHRLAVVPRAAMAALVAATEQFHRDESAAGVKGLGIPCVSANNEPCVLHVLPLARGRLRQSAGAGAIAAIFVASRTAPPQAPMQLVRALFGLTEAEGEVYALVAAGSTVANAAARLGVQPSTVRSHLLRIFEKTGTHRQSELAVLAASLATPAGATAAL